MDPAMMGGAPPPGGAPADPAAGGDPAAILQGLSQKIDQLVAAGGGAGGAGGPAKPPKLDPVAEVQAMRKELSATNKMIAALCAALEQIGVQIKFEAKDILPDDVVTDQPTQPGGDAGGQPQQQKTSAVADLAAFGKILAAKIAQSRGTAAA